MAFFGYKCWCEGGNIGGNGQTKERKRYACYVMSSNGMNMLFDDDDYLYCYQCQSTSIHQSINHIIITIIIIFV